MTVQIDSTVALVAVKVVAGLLQLQADDRFADLRDDIAAFNAKVRARLPEKPDGSPWTDDDVHAAADAARAPLDRIDAQHPEADSHAADGTGQP